MTKMFLCNSCMDEFDESELVDGKTPDHLGWFGQCGDPECYQSDICNAVGQVPKKMYDDESNKYKPYAL